MANDLLPAARSAFARGEISWTGDDFLAILLDSATYDDTWQYRDDLTAAELATAALAGTVVRDGGICDADDTTVTGLGIGDTARALVIVRDTGSGATSEVVYFADQNDDTTPISVVGDGSAVVLRWSDSATAVFQL